MTRFSAFSVAVTCAVAVLASPALAGGHCGQGHRMLQRLDLNGDGGISRAESEAREAKKGLRGKPNPVPPWEWGKRRN